MSIEIQPILKYETLSLRSKLMRRGAVLASVIATAGVAGCGEESPRDVDTQQNKQTLPEKSPSQSRKSTEPATADDSYGNPCDDRGSATSSCEDRGGSEEALGIESSEFEDKQLATTETNEEELLVMCEEIFEATGQTGVLPIFERDDPESHILDYYYC